MRYLLTFLLAVGMLSPVAHAGVDTDKLMGGVLRASARALQAGKEKLSSGEKEGDLPAGEEAAPAAEEEAGRTWGTRSREMVAAFLDGTTEGLGEQPLSQWFSRSVKQALDILLHEYKEQYKEEGRLYAQEIGDKLVERIREDPKINASLTSIQALCWGVIIYLTVVTLFMVTALLRLKRTHAQLLAAVEELKRKADSQVR